jgi:hypothetical protein
MVLLEKGIISSCKGLSDFIVVFFSFLYLLSLSAILKGAVCNLRNELKEYREFCPDDTNTNESEEEQEWILDYPNLHISSSFRYDHYYKVIQKYFQDYFHYIYNLSDIKDDQNDSNNEKQLAIQKLLEVTYQEDMKQFLNGITRTPSKVTTVITGNEDTTRDLSVTNENILDKKKIFHLLKKYSWKNEEKEGMLKFLKKIERIVSSFLFSSFFVNPLFIMIFC